MWCDGVGVVLGSPRLPRGSRSMRNELEGAATRGVALGMWCSVLRDWGSAKRVVHAAPESMGYSGLMRGKFAMQPYVAVTLEWPCCVGPRDLSIWSGDDEVISAVGCG